MFRFSALAVMAAILAAAPAAATATARPCPSSRSTRRLAMRSSPTLPQPAPPTTSVLAGRCRRFR